MDHQNSLVDSINENILDDDRLAKQETDMNGAIDYPCRQIERDQIPDDKHIDLYKMATTVTAAVAVTEAMTNENQDIIDRHGIDGDPIQIMHREDNESQMTPSKKSRIAAIPGKPRGATYDGNACMICSDRASGFHYGVLACEGCKGFFKRICKEPNETQTKRHCVYGGNCDINLRTRNRCQHCRIQKCIQLGMSKDGIKLGRRSRKFKENLIQIVSTSSSSPNTSPTTTMTLAQTHIASPSTTNSTSTTTNTTATTNLFHQIDLISKSLLNDVNKLSQQHTNVDLLNAHHQLNIGTGHATHTSNPNHNNNNNSYITINADSQIQQIIIPTDQSQLMSTSNAKVIAIIQDNRLILKTIDIPQQQQQHAIVSTPTGNTVTTANDSTTTSTCSSSNSNSSSSSTTDTLVSIQPKQETNDPIEYHQPQASQKLSIYQILDATQIQQINESILQAHKETWPYLKEKCKKLKQLYNQQTHVQSQHIKQRQMHMQLEQYFSNGLMGFFGETKFLEFFNQLIENTVLFAKIVPYFMDMHESDRIAMLKSCVFEIICVRHMLLFDQNCKLFLPLYEIYISKEYLAQKFPDYVAFIGSLFDFHNIFFELFDLNDMEIAIFCSFLLFNTDDDVQLNDSEKLITYRNLFRGLLINELCRNHGQQCKESDIQVWLDKCCAKLKNLNYEHSQILMRLKKTIQFPDLYAELYNL